jgi:hypothetical protein
MLPYLTIALAKSAGGIDNRAPRPLGLAPARGLGASKSLRGVPRFCRRDIRCETDTRATEPDRPVGRHFRAFARDLYGTVHGGSGHSAIDRLVAWPDRCYLAVRARRLRIELAPHRPDTDRASFSSVENPRNQFNGKGPEIGIACPAFTTRARFTWKRLAESLSPAVLGRSHPVPRGLLSHQREPASCR